MAALRTSAALGQPDLLAKVVGFGGLGILPATRMAGTTASPQEKSLVAERRKAVADVREDLFG